MGPRPYGRGNKLNGDEVDRVVKLQWGRDHMVAEMSLNKAMTAGKISLQWGRDHMVAEMGREAPIARCRNPASMGPRPYGRGNVVPTTTPLRAPSLQWGRDHMVAEIRRCRNGAVKPGRLQWGRDHMVAEIQPKSSSRRSRLALQWGRDHMVAEIIPWVCHWNRTLGFNGAATIWSRKLLAQDLLSPQADQAQLASGSSPGLPWSHKRPSGEHGSGWQPRPRGAASGSRLLRSTEPLASTPCPDRLKMPDARVAPASCQASCLASCRLLSRPAGPPGRRRYTQRR